MIKHVPSTDPVYKHLPKDLATVENGRHWVRYSWPEEVIDATRIAHPSRKTPTSQPAHLVNILAATFGVNRAAK